MSARSQINLLAKALLEEFGGPTCNKERPCGEGAGDMAVRLLCEMRDAICAAMNELGVPGDGYPAKVANAYAILAQALGHPQCKDESYVKENGRS